jgi:diguanylate cyclase (GGDEF)-like protein
MVQASYLRHIPKLPLPQPVLVASIAAFCLLVFSFIKHKGAIESGFLWALLASFCALAAKPGSISTIYFSTAGLILIVAVIEASYVMAFRDELTGLPARRSLNECLLKMGRRYTVAMVDVDFFKKFNDTYGHDVGDQVLRMVASKLCAVTGGGKAFRYGGEEFAVIFPGKLMGETIPHLEQLRMAIGSAGFAIRGRNRPRKKPAKSKRGKGHQKRVSVTVSMGVAERKELHAKPHDVIKAADKALYRAKKAGRNRVST